jgi:predicted metal-dependent hydrolase
VSSPETEGALREWAQRFNQRRYFEAHEVLEGPWLRAVEPEKSFLKGLIHAAVALYQYRRGNGHGARTKYRSCCRYLAGSLPERGGVDVEALLGEMDAFFAELLAQPEGTAPPPPKAPWPIVTVRGYGG